MTPASGVPPPSSHEQAHRQLGGRRGDVGVDAPLEPLGRLGRQAVAARRAGHRRRVEVGRLDEHVGRGRAHLGRLAAHDAGDGQRGVAAVDDEQVLGVEGAVDVVEGLQPLPRPRPADADRARQGVEVEGVQRLAEQHHHVVGDVDGQADRTHPDLGQALLHPRRRGGVHVDPTHDPGDVAVAPLVAVDRRAVGELHGIPAAVGRRDLDVRGVAEAAAGGQRVLARDAAHREAVAAVGRDVDLDHLVGEAEQLDGVLARLEAGDDLGVVAQPLLEDDDAVVVVAEAELHRGADHAVGDVAVGLAGADLERAGEHAAGQDADDVVAGLEVVGAADDALRGALGEHLAVLADVDLAPVDGLAVLLLLGRHLEHPADDQRALDVAAVQRLLLQTHLDQARGDVGTGGPRGHVGQLSQP